MTKHILITGGNRGLGLACIKLLLSSTCSSDRLHILMGTRNIEAGEHAISNHLSQYQTQITPIQIDVCDKVSIAKAVEKVRSISPKLSVLINNAGILDGPDVIKTNFKGVVDVTDAFLPLLLEGASKSNDEDNDTAMTLPCIIATSSSAGTRFMASLPQHQSQILLSEELTIDTLTSKINELAKEKDVDIYSLSKTAVNCHTQIIARKYKDRINAIAVSPGFTNTGMCVNYTGKRQPKSVELGASVFYEALYGLGRGKSGIFLKQNSSAGTAVEDAETIETKWST